MGKIIRCTVTVAAIAVLLLSGLFVLMGNNQDMYVFNKRPMIMSSDRFEPGIKENSICLARKVESEDRIHIEKGDIVTCIVHINNEPVVVCDEVVSIVNGTITLGEEGVATQQIRVTDVKSSLSENDVFYFPLALLVLMPVLSIIWVIGMVICRMKTRKRRKKIAASVEE